MSCAEPADSDTWCAPEMSTGAPWKLSPCVRYQRTWIAPALRATSSLATGWLGSPSVPPLAALSFGSRIRRTLAPRREEYPPARHQLVEAKRELDNVGVYPIALVRWLTE